MALTSATVAKPNPINQKIVAPVADMPTGTQGCKFRIKKLKSLRLYTKSHKPNIRVCDVNEITETIRERFIRDPSSESIDNLKKICDRVIEIPANRPINVPKDSNDLNNDKNIPKKLSDNFANDKRITAIEPVIMPTNTCSVITAFKIIISISAAKRTSIFEKATPVAKFL